MSSLNEACESGQQNTAVSVLPAHKNTYPLYRKQLKNEQGEAFDIFLAARGNKVGKTEMRVLDWLRKDQTNGIRHKGLLLSVKHYNEVGWPKNAVAFHYSLGDFVKKVERVVHKDPFQGTYSPSQTVYFRHRKIGHA